MTRAVTICFSFWSAAIHRRFCFLDAKATRAKNKSGDKSPHCKWLSLRAQVVGHQNPDPLRSAVGTPGRTAGVIP
jgi:hypothetical protein